MRGALLRPSSLRGQFAFVIALLSFLPNVIIVLVLGRFLGLTDVTLILGWMSIVALVSGLIGYALSRALLAPLVRLTRELDERDLREAHLDDPVEVRSLRLAFGRLLTHLAQERVRRNAFMATLVHDLKTPLIATSHLVSVLQNDAVSAQDRGHLYQNLLEENGRLLRLVQQMADAHKFEREVVPLTLGDVDLRAFAEDLAARVRLRAAERGVSVRVLGAGTARVDLVQCERAVMNLIDNALRYAWSTVELRVAPGVVRVANDGPPLARPLAELAQPFNAQPVEIAGERYTAGTAGLGLFIAHRVAEAHGGELRYEREGECTILEMRFMKSSSTSDVVQETTA